MYVYVDVKKKDVLMMEDMVQFYGCNSGTIYVGWYMLPLKQLAVGVIGAGYTIVSNAGISCDIRVNIY